MSVPFDRTPAFVVDQPSSVFSSFGVPEIFEVGVDLDPKLVGLPEALGAPVPALQPRVLGSDRPKR